VTEASVNDAARRHAGDEAPERMVEEIAPRPLAGPSLAIFCLVTVLAVAVTLNQLLNLQLFAGIVFIESRYLYLLAALLLPLAFLAYSGSGDAETARVPWYDWL